MEGDRNNLNPHLDAALAAGQEADALADREAQVLDQLERHLAHLDLVLHALLHPSSFHGSNRTHLMTHAE